MKRVITGATQIITNCFKKNLEAIPGKNSSDSLQKIAILGMSHVIWATLQSDT
jgi:hypothetical protein